MKLIIDSCKSVIYLTVFCPSKMHPLMMTYLVAMFNDAIVVIAFIGLLYCNTCAVFLAFGYGK